MGLGPGGWIIDLILGVMIWHDLPASGLWVIGLFLGINLVFRGINWIALAWRCGAFRAGDALMRSTCREGGTLGSNSRIPSSEALLMHLEMTYGLVLLLDDRTVQL